MNCFGYKETVVNPLKEIYELALIFIIYSKLLSEAIAFIVQQPVHSLKLLLAVLFLSDPSIYSKSKIKVCFEVMSSQ
jgi:hypothetical protein